MRQAVDEDSSRALWHGLKDWLRRHVRRLTNAALVLILVLILLHHVLPDLFKELAQWAGFDALHATAILTLMVLLLVLERVFTIEDELLLKRDLKLGAQRQLYQEVIDKIADGRIRADKIIFLQHSGTTVSQEICRLAEEVKGIELVLYQQAPSCACLVGATDIIKRIQHVLSDLEYRDSVNKFKSRVIVKQFSAPASLRAMIVDKKIIVLSWYLHLQTDSGLKVQGSENIGMYVNSGAPEFEPIHNSLMNSIHSYDSECAMRKNNSAGNVEVWNC